MAQPIVMPKAGQSMTEGKVVTWLKKEGEAIRQGEPILEIETDKANLEVEAQSSGILRKILVAQGETCPVLTLIGVIGEAGEAIDVEALKRDLPAASEETAERAPAPPAAPAAPPSAAPAASRPTAPPPSPAPPPRAPGSPPPAPVGLPAAAAIAPAFQPRPAAVAALPPGKAPPGGKVFASPLARRLARERGVDLSLLRGTGPGGRILERDVENAPARPVAAGRGDGAGPLLMPSPKPYPPPSPRPTARIPVEGMRKAIGSALQQSKQTIPHFYASIRIDATAALELKRSWEAQGAKISINDIVVRACVIALADEPRVSCRVFPDRIEYPEDVNVGIAVGQEEGLVVPVVVKAQTRDLAALAAEIKRIVAAAHAGKLIGSGQGTFTVSNLGMFGVESFSAIINPPEGGILAVGAVTPEVVPFLGGLVPRSMLHVTLSVDHRAIDGILAARFLARLKHLIESPERL